MATATQPINSASNPTYAQLLERIKQLEAAATVAAKQAERKANTVDLGNGMTAYVGDKGTLCVRGFGKFPVALYYEQWLKLLAAATAIANAAQQFKATGKLSVKPPKAAAAGAPTLPQ